MPQRRTIEAEGLVLDRAPAGENHLRLVFLTPTHGLLRAMLRESRPGGRSAATQTKSRSGGGTVQRPDLFDHATVLLDSPEPGAAHGSPYFVKEYKLVQRYSGIGGRYPALEAASALAAIVARHAAHFESCAPVFALCCHAFAALDGGAPPEAVRLKALFMLARAEGYPAQEQWLVSLQENDRELALTLLNRPAAEAAALDAKGESRLPRLRKDFERWLAGHTDFEPNPRLKTRSP